MYIGGFDGGRAAFPTFLNNLDAKQSDVAVELGTHLGDFAVSFLSEWNGGELYCIDPYISGYDDGDPVSLRSDDGRSADMDTALMRLIHFGQRAVLRRISGNEAAKEFSDGRLSFVYVDACHQTEAVLNDLKIWWPKLKSGGVMAGHDIVCVGERNGGWGRLVQPAVEAFAETVKLPIHLVAETTGMPWSYYFIKP